MDGLSCVCVWEDCDLRHDSLSAKPMAREREIKREIQIERESNVQHVFD